MKAQGQVDMPSRAAEVLRYFLRNPHAADSLEGVVRWRLTEETVHRNVREVDEALRWLVERSLLRVQTARGTTPIFSLNHEKIGDIEDLLAGEGREPR